MEKSLPIENVFDDAELLGPLFPGTTFWPQLALLKAAFGRPLTKRERELFDKCTKRSIVPTRPVKYLTWISGRRSCKSRLAGQVVAIYLGLFFNYRKYLSPGERGVIVIIAADRQQAKVIFQYVSAALHSCPAFSSFIENETQQMISLRTGIDIEVATCNYRTVRGRTIVAALLDEVSFWHVEGASPDVEVLNALVPAMSTIPNAMLWILTTPYARKGIVYEYYRKHFGKDSREHLVWQSATRVMNETVPQSLIDAELEKDRAKAQAEWLGIFRTDIESFVSLDAVRACVMPGRRELPPSRGVRYFAFCDPSGGKIDSFTCAIGHAEGVMRVLDALVEIRAPFSPAQAVHDVCRVLARYNIKRVIGDCYGGSWPMDMFRSHGVVYTVCKETKSELYKALLPLINSEQVEFLNHTRLIAQLGGLERKVGPLGKDRIDHPRGQLDDCANAVAGLMATKTVVKLGAWGTEFDRAERYRSNDPFPGRVYGSTLINTLNHQLS